MATGYPQLVYIAIRSTVIVLGLIAPAHSAELEFEGTPALKVQMLNGAVHTTPISPTQAADLRVAILRDGDAFLWKSRGNVPMIRRESGGYITFIAATGSGYVRMLSPDMRKLREQLPPGERDREFVYVEHLVNQLGSVTYFGR